MIPGNTTYQVLLIRIPSEWQLIPIYSGANAKEENYFLSSVGPYEVRNLEAFAHEGSRIKYFCVLGGRDIFLNFHEKKKIVSSLLGLTDLSVSC